MSKYIAYALLVPLTLAAVFVACGQENGPAGKDVPEWCFGAPGSPASKREHGLCRFLTGTVVSVDPPTSVSANAVITPVMTMLKVDTGGPELARVSMDTECNTWEPGDKFAEWVAQFNEYGHGRHC